MSDVKIKPCPFCGDTYIRLHTSMKDKREGYYTIGCNTVNCIGLHCNGKLYKTKTEAVEAWNRRTCNETDKLRQDILNMLEESASELKQKLNDTRRLDYSEILVLTANLYLTELYVKCINKLPPVKNKEDEENG